ncbi:RyR domain-containing protein [Pseudomonas sp. OTU750018]|uniref:RyR domain-containing protein n=1 Tax=Pseudomonas sp. OTU750018 TaxID=2709708 RepID=UPI0014247D25|nr:RyR domain-containing protein [Pseudomonas sp. OTU750018]
MNRESIAKVAHQINLAYCASLGDTSQPAWADAPDWQKQSAMAGVDMHLANPDATPEQSHESWLAQKVADGWVYGDVKDADAKTHPCCLPFAELSPEQKAKNYLFRAVVHALRDEPDAVAKEPEPQATARAAQPVVVVGVGEVGVKYIGRREIFVDRLFGTGLSFEQGQVRVFPGVLARKFLRHADQFEEAAVGEPATVADTETTDETAQALAKAKKLQDEQTLEQNQLQDVRDQIASMTKKGLEEFAMTKYNQKLDARKSVGDLRVEVTGFIDRFGVV